MSTIDLDRAVETFAASTDFTVGLEEEFAILDPQTLDLAPRFEELRDAAASVDPTAARAHHRRADLVRDRDHLGRRRGPALTRSRRQRERRRALFALAAARGAELGATGTHPWADYREQPIIDTEHYRRVEEGLKYVAWRNNTFSLHVHVGVRDIDRAVRVCDRMRPLLPLLLARLGELAVPRRAARPGCTPRARRPSRAASRAAGCRTRSAAGRRFAATSSC